MLSFLGAFAVVRLLELARTAGQIIMGNRAVREDQGVGARRVFEVIRNPESLHQPRRKCQIALAILHSVFEGRVTTR